MCFQFPERHEIKLRNIIYSSEGLLLTGGPGIPGGPLGPSKPRGPYKQKHTQTLTVNLNEDQYNTLNNKQQNEQSCHGNTHWFTWEAPGSDFSIISLEMHKAKKSLIKVK